MKKYYNDDEPLFHHQDEASQETPSLELNLELYKLQSEQGRKNLMLSFGIKLTIAIIVTLFILIALDIFVQKRGYDNSLIAECFSVIKYALSTVLGYLFASKQEG